MLSQEQDTDGAHAGGIVDQLLQRLVLELSTSSRSTKAMSSNALNARQSSQSRTVQPAFPCQTRTRSSPGHHFDLEAVLKNKSRTQDSPAGSTMNSSAPVCASYPATTQLQNVRRVRISHRHAYLTPTGRRSPYSVNWCTAPDSRALRCCGSMSWAYVPRRWTSLRGDGDAIARAVLLAEGSGLVDKLCSSLVTKVRFGSVCVKP